MGAISHPPTQSESGNGMVRPCSRPASQQSWQRALKPADCCCAAQLVSAKRLSPSPILLGFPLHCWSICILHFEPIRRTGAVTRIFGSALWCVGCERVIRIAGIHKIGTGGAQQSFDLLDRSSNYAARLASPNLAL
jgi:hypothetical protein